MSKTEKKVDGLLEQRACKEAKQEAIEAAVQWKRDQYLSEIKRFIRTERNARELRKEADRLRSLLSITDKEVSQLLQE